MKVQSAKFVSKRIEVAAVQFKVADSDIGKQLNINDEVELTIFGDDGSPFLMIPTRSGTQRCNNGDYIIKELDGNGYYPCGQTVFEQKYESI